MEGRSDMVSFRLLIMTGTAALLAIAPPASGKIPSRVRGTITAVGDSRITVKERDGGIFTLKTGPDTTYADVVPSSLDEIKPNEFIGTAVKGPRSRWIAVEIVLVHESLRAGRRGCYAWDPLPDTSGITATTMTNGSVSGVSTATPELTNTTMTNGTVVACEGRANGRRLKVILVGNKTARILVSSTAPIVRFVPSGRAAASVGATAVVWTKPGGRAALVAVGKGVTPPM